MSDKVLRFRSRLASPLVALLFVMLFSFSLVAPHAAEAAAPQQNVATTISASPYWHYTSTYQTLDGCNTAGQAAVNNGTALQYQCTAWKYAVSYWPYIQYKTIYGLYLYY